MSKSILLVLAALSSASALAAPVTYSCGGNYGTKGEITVTLNGSTLTVKGGFRDETGDSVDVDCTAKLNSRHSAQWQYFDATNRTCAFDMARVEKGIGAEGSVSLVIKGGGDTHDYSGYVYRNFFCKR
jgi:hypothetical protein